MHDDRKEVTMDDIQVKPFKINNLRQFGLRSQAVSPTDKYEEFL